MEKTPWELWCIDQDFIPPSRVIWREYRTWPSVYNAPIVPPAHYKGKHQAYMAKNLQNGVVTRHGGYTALSKALHLCPKSFHATLARAHAKGCNVIHGLKVWKAGNPEPRTSQIRMDGHSWRKPITLRHGIDIQHFPSYALAEDDLGLPRDCISTAIKRGQTRLPLGWIILHEEGGLTKAC